MNLQINQPESHSMALEAFIRRMLEPVLRYYFPSDTCISIKLLPEGPEVDITDGTEFHVTVVKNHVERCVYSFYMGNED